MRVSRDVIIQVVWSENVYYLVAFNHVATISDQPIYLSSVEAPYVFDIVGQLREEDLADFHEKRLAIEFDKPSNIEFQACDTFVQFVLDRIADSIEEK